MECEYLTATDIAELLGVARQTIYNWRKRGKLPAETWLGPRTQRWSKAEIVAWMADQRTV